MPDAPDLSLAKELGFKLLHGGFREYQDKKREAYLGDHLAPELGIAVNEDLKNAMGTKITHNLDWNRTAVDNLNASLIFDAFAPPELGATRFLYQNNGYQVVEAAVKNATIGACAFVSVRRGNVAKGEKPVIYTAYTGAEATGKWSNNRGGLEAGLVIESYWPETPRMPRTYLFFAPGWVLRLNDKFEVIGGEAQPIDECLLTPFVFNQDVAHNPFGESYLSKGALASFEAAQRLYGIIQLVAHVYGIPHTIMMASIQNPSSLKGKKISTAIAHITQFIDTTGNAKLDFKQLEAVSPKPIADALNLYQMSYAAQMRISPGLVGYTTANGPASEGALKMDARSNRALINSCRNTMGSAIRDITRQGIMLASGSPANDFDLLTPLFQEDFDIDKVTGIGDTMMKSGDFLDEFDLAKMKQRIGFTQRERMLRVEPSFTILRPEAEDLLPEADFDDEGILTPRNTPTVEII